MLPAGRSTLRFGASALVPDATEDADEHVPELPPEELPDDVLIYTLPARQDRQPLASAAAGRPANTGTAARLCAMQIRVGRVSASGVPGG
jgi:hypothetical protein